jgi:hypothetical protein
MTAPAPSPHWIARVAKTVRQEPLLDTRISLASLRRTNPARRPQAIFVGFGLCSRGELTEAVPLDLLGMLLPAEAIRRAAGAGELVALIADRHAMDNGFAPAQVEERANRLDAVLSRIQLRCGFESLTVLRASEFCDEPEYRSALASVRRRSGPGTHDYVLRQLADALYLERHHGALIKVGWALRGTDAFRRRDEIAFDRALRAVEGDRVGFLYCKPGRALSDDAPRVPPYIATQPETRLCLDRLEDPATKLAAAASHLSPHTVEGCRRHLRAVLYSYGRLVEPLPRGCLEDRLAALLCRLGPAVPEAAALAGAALAGALAQHRDAC